MHFATFYTHLAIIIIIIIIIIFWLVSVPVMFIAHCTASRHQALCFACSLNVCRSLLYHSVTSIFSSSVHLLRGLLGRLVPFVIPHSTALALPIASLTLLGNCILGKLLLFEAS